MWRPDAICQAQSSAHFAQKVAGFFAIENSEPHAQSAQDKSSYRYSPANEVRHGTLLDRFSCCRARESSRASRRLGAYRGTYESSRAQQVFYNPDSYDSFMNLRES